MFTIPSTFWVLLVLLRILFTMLHILLWRTLLSRPPVLVYLVTVLSWRCLSELAVLLIVFYALPLPYDSLTFNPVLNFVWWFLLVGARVLYEDKTLGFLALDLHNVSRSTMEAAKICTSVGCNFLWRYYCSYNIV